MKIALLTIWREKNYGAELQAYATIKTLQQMGHDVEMIDIRLSDCARFNWKGHIGHFLSKLGPGHRDFCTFWKENIPVTRRYRSLAAIKANPPKADIYLVGSDQVWNPQLTRDFATLYFLDFGDDNTKRISYASSFGTDKWNFPDLKDDIRRLLKRFNRVTCREDSGVQMLKNDFGIDSRQVVDPTLLLESYKDLTGEIEEKETLVYYPLSHDPKMEEYSKSLAKRLRLTAINNKQCSTILKIAEWNRVSIAEWVKNIAEAKFVVTRSFHGMVFSIIHKRQFAVVAGSHGRSTRLTSLLKLLGLEDRFFESIESLDKAEPWTKRIDYSIILPKLKDIRKNSIEILKSCIES